ncbi:oligopeptide transporter, OPT family [bacterium]|nr:oligopeptide transporter, OPT family [bacterium]
MNQNSGTIERAATGAPLGWKGIPDRRLLTSPALPHIPSMSTSHEPYVSADRSLTELTIGSVVLGCVLGLIFAASSVYLALKVGLTVSASIPIAVLSITIFRSINKALGNTESQILRNNLVQTVGSAGESIAAGVVFTLPALLLLGYTLPWTKVAAIALVGGLLGILLMIPLRRSLIVKEHDVLKYPEGTACAEVLIVGEERGVQAKTVFLGFGLGALYKFLNIGVQLWQEVPAKILSRMLPNGKSELIGEIRAEVSPELTGVGYIIGARVGGYLFAGGMLSFFVLIPAIKLFGAGLTSPIFPATMLISNMTPMQVRSNYVFYIGAGAVTAAGLISLFRALPMIAQAMIAGFSDVRGVASGALKRTEQEVSMTWVVGGVIACGVAMVTLPQIGINVPGAILAIVFAFLFVSVSSRICGQIGASSNPISGMTVAAVLLTSLIFFAVGWTGIEHRVLALSIGGVVCVAAAVGAATSQDLKTGYLVGATPRSQQIGLLFGVTTSAIMIGGMISFLNNARTTIVARDYPGVQIAAFDAEPMTLDGTSYKVGRLFERTGDAPAGRYLVDNAGAIKFLVDPGIGGREETDYKGNKVTKFDSPKAQIMALVVDGILTQKLPWGLILIGAFIAIVMELLGLPSLAVAVGTYLPISTSATIFMGGIIRWAVERKPAAGMDTGDSGPGVLFSSGLIAGGAILGVALAALQAAKLDHLITATSLLGESLNVFTENPLVAVAAYVLFLAVPLYKMGRKTAA